MTKTSIDRAFEILDLLDGNQPSITQEAVAEQLKFTRSTSYRYLQTLCNAGLLMQVQRGVYCLGPRIIELERKIQIGDPLLSCARNVLPKYVNLIPESALLLCGLWGDRVLCLYQETSTVGKSPDFVLERARGLPFPLTRGAASLAILANLSAPRLKSLFLQHSMEIAKAGLGSQWKDFRQKMREYRKSGFVLTSGTFGSQLTAVAVAILNEDNDVIGSLTRILRSHENQETATLVQSVQVAADDFKNHLRNSAGTQIGGSTDDNLDPRLDEKFIEMII